MEDDYHIIRNHWGHDQSRNRLLGMLWRVLRFENYMPDNKIHNPVYTGALTWHVNEFAMDVRWRLGDPLLVIRRARNTWRRELRMLV